MAVAENQYPIFTTSGFGASLLVLKLLRKRTIAAPIDF
jgi:hypothetical protein